MFLSVINISPNPFMKYRAFMLRLSQFNWRSRLTQLSIAFLALSTVFFLGMYRGALLWDFALLCNMRKIESLALWMKWMEQRHDGIFKTMREENIELFLPDFSTSLFDDLSSSVHQSAKEGEKQNKTVSLIINRTITHKFIDFYFDWRCCCSRT